MEFPMHWLIILVVILVLFGGRKIPELMRGMGEGVRGFKEGMHGANQSQSQNGDASHASSVTGQKGRLTRRSGLRGGRLFGGQINFVLTKAA